MSLAMLLYSWLVPTGVVIGHVGIAGKILRNFGWLDRVARWMALGWAVVLAITWVLRVRIAGHLPIFGTYESALSLALAVMVSAVVWETVGKGRVVITPLAALTAAVAWASPIR